MTDEKRPTLPSIPPYACSTCMMRRGLGTCSTCSIRLGRGVDDLETWLLLVVEALRHPANLTLRLEVLDWATGHDVKLRSSAPGKSDLAAEGLDANLLHVGLSGLDFRASDSCQRHQDIEPGWGCILSNYGDCLGRWRDPLAAEMSLRLNGGCCGHKHDASKGAAANIDLPPTAHGERGQNSVGVGELGEAALRFRRLVQASFELFRDRERALEWLIDPNLRLHGMRPIMAVFSDEWTQEVEDLIGRLRHGVF